LVRHPYVLVLRQNVPLSTVVPYTTLFRSLRDEGITAMHFVPSLLGLFLSLPGVNQWRTLQRVPIGGEALPGEVADKLRATFDALDRKSTRLNSSHGKISYAVFCWTDINKT